MTIADWIRDWFRVTDVAILGYFLVINTSYLLLIVLAAAEFVKHLRQRRFAGLDEMYRSPLTPGVSVLVPAHNEETGIVASVQGMLALRYVAANLTARRLAAEIGKAANRIHELAARVKKQTHMDRTPVVDAIPLEETLADTLALIGSKARSKAVTLELKVAPNLPRLQGILGELNQVWLNLIDNAIDAAPDGGHVTVAAGHERDSIVVHVIDDGPGITAADLDRIFDQFYTTKPVGKGTGLGLPTAQAIVLGHRGTIQVESRPGHTEFRVCLPAAPAAIA